MEHGKKKLIEKFNETHKDEVVSLAINPDSTYFISGSKDQSLKLFKIYKDKRLCEWKKDL